MIVYILEGCGKKEGIIIIIKINEVGLLLELRFSWLIVLLGAIMGVSYRVEEMIGNLLFLLLNGHN